MKTNSLESAVLQMLIGCVFIGFFIGLLAAPETPYYDGEGNQLPKEAVTALVRSQYVKTTPKEDSLITKYFK